MSNSDKDIVTIVNRITSRKITAQLRAAMPIIESKLSNGIEHQEIVKVLRDKGYNVTLQQFRGVLYRYRRQYGIVKLCQENQTPEKTESENSGETESKSGFRFVESKFDLEVYASLTNESEKT